MQWWRISLKHLIENQQDQGYDGTWRNEHLLTHIKQGFVVYCSFVRSIALHGKDANGLVCIVAGSKADLWENPHLIMSLNICVMCWIGFCPTDRHCKQMKPCSTVYYCLLLCSSNLCYLPFSVCVVHYWETNTDIGMWNCQKIIV